VDVTRLPFNALIGLENDPPGSGFLVSLPAGPRYTNHLGTVHASALLAVAEAGSAVCLLRHLGDRPGFVPVVRRLEAKFRKPATGRVSARSVLPAAAAQWPAALTDRGRILTPVPVDVVDESGTVVLSAVVEWFIATGNPQPNG
jgi:acyl-coenzyme A thioesterase PaaI-like protein